MARGLKERFPGCRVRLVYSSNYLGDSLGVLARHNPLLDELIDVCPHDFTDEATIRAQPAIAKSKPRPLSEHPTTLVGADLVLPMDTPCWLGEARELREFGTVRTPRTDLWIRAAGLDLSPSSKKPVYVTTDEERAWALGYARSMGWLQSSMPLAMVALSSHAQPRTLPPRRALEIMDGLLAAGVRPVALGAGYPCVDHEQVMAVPLERAIALIEIADVFVGVDSGLMHAAGAVGTPIVALFGPTDPTMRLGYYDRVVAITAGLPCQFCWYSYPCRDVSFGAQRFECLSSISTESVVATVRGIL